MVLALSLSHSLAPPSKLKVTLKQLQKKLKTPSLTWQSMCPKIRLIKQLSPAVLERHYCFWAKRWHRIHQSWAFISVGGLGLGPISIRLGLGASFDSFPVVTQASVAAYESLLQFRNRYSKKQADMNQITMSQCQRKSPHGHLEINHSNFLHLICFLTLFKRHFLK